MLSRVLTGGECQREDATGAGAGHPVEVVHHGPSEVQFEGLQHLDEHQATNASTVQAQNAPSHSRHPVSNHFTINENTCCVIQQNYMYMVIGEPNLTNLI